MAPYPGRPSSSALLPQPASQGSVKQGGNPAPPPPTRKVFDLSSVSSASSRRSSLDLEPAGSQSPVDQKRKLKRPSLADLAPTAPSSSISLPALCRYNGNTPIPSQGTSDSPENISRESLVTIPEAKEDVTPKGSPHSIPNSETVKDANSTTPSPVGSPDSAPTRGQLQPPRSAMSQQKVEYLTKLSPEHANLAPTAPSSSTDLPELCRMSKLSLDRTLISALSPTARSSSNGADADGHLEETRSDFQDEDGSNVRQNLTPEAERELRSLLKAAQKSQK